MMVVHVVVIGSGGAVVTSDRGGVEREGAASL